MAFKKRAKKAPETFHFEETGGAMGLAEEMRNLSQEIVNAFDTRVSGLATLREETATKLQGFRREMTSFRHEFRRQAAELRQFLRAGQEARSQQVSGMLAGFRRMFSGLQQDRQAAARHWRSMAAAMAKKRASLAR